MDDAVFRLRAVGVIRLSALSRVDERLKAQAGAHIQMRIGGDHLVTFSCPGWAPDLRHRVTAALAAELGSGWIVDFQPIP